MAENPAPVMSNVQKNRGDAVIATASRLSLSMTEKNEI